MSDGKSLLSDAEFVELWEGIWNGPVYRLEMFVEPMRHLLALAKLGLAAQEASSPCPLAMHEVLQELAWLEAGQPVFGKHADQLLRLLNWAQGRINREEGKG